MNSFKTIIYQKERGVARITLNRPEVRNAVNLELITELNEALSAARGDEGVRVVVITGAGSAFCSGIDLAFHRGKTGLEYRSFMEKLYREMTDIQYSMGKSTIAAVNGPALAAGCTIAFSCDMVIASEKAKIGYPEINVGMMPGMHLVLLPRLVGKHKGFELAFTGEPISAREAERMGLINRAVPHEEFETAVGKLAMQLADKSPLVMKYCRDMFYRGLDVEFRKAIADAADAMCILVSSEDAQEGMSAFLEKREPRWKGK